MSVFGTRAHDRASAQLAAAVTSFSLGVEANRILGNTWGSAEVAFARQVAMYLCHVAFELSLGRVAAAFEALSKLAPTLRRVVEQAVLHEQGLEAIERAENWPPRSGKIALKLGLAQLAQQRG